uniref:Uncharacterized protein n=1 Tax=Arundo donax TaxID=35708 RepID=A0A0A9FR20_ARUDO
MSNKDNQKGKIMHLYFIQLL